MSPENDAILRIGRLEDKITLYEPFLTSLQGVASIPAEINKIHIELRVLRESRIKMRGRLTTLFEAQTKVYDDTIKLLEEKTRTFDNIIPKLVFLEQELTFVKTFGNRLDVAEKTIESFKLKGWDLLLRIVPWVIAVSASLWAVLIK